MTTRPRHSWLKVAPHTRICTRCGCGKVSAQRDGRWFATFHLPSGESVESRTVPVCKPGARTVAALMKYRDAIRAAAGRKGMAA